MASVPSLPVNRAWFLALQAGLVDEELRSATPRWRKALLLSAPEVVRFVNGYRSDSPFVFRTVESVDLVSASSLRPGEAEAHGFGPSDQVIRMRLEPLLGRLAR